MLSKSFDKLVGILLTVLMIFIMMGMILVSEQMTNARDFQSLVIDRIQSSYYAPSVIQECKDKASEYGYELTIKDMTIYDDRKDVLVTTKYKVKFILFDIGLEKEIQGYAR